MIIGIGTDILSIRRIRDGFTDSGDAFIKKSFTEKEQRQAMARSDPVVFYAACFAGKEAVFKCFGIDGDDVRLNEIEILRTDTGQPQVSLLGDLRIMAKSRGIKDIQISLSYDDDHAVAFALAQG